MLAGILYKNCKPLRKSALAATWCQCPKLSDPSPASIQKKREPALTGRLSFCYADKIGTRYKRGQKKNATTTAVMDRTSQVSLTFGLLGRVSHLRNSRPAAFCAESKKRRGRKAYFATTWCRWPELAGSSPASIQKKREPALTGQLSLFGKR